jgi:hypothetical protein
MATRATFGPSAGCRASALPSRGEMVALFHFGFQYVLVERDGNKLCGSAAENSLKLLYGRDYAKVLIKNARGEGMYYNNHALVNG